VSADSNFDKDARRRCLAMNAIREAMLLDNRWDKPFTDDDAARCDAIFQLLHLQQVESTEYEHAPLTAANQKPVSAALPKIANLLEQSEATSRIEPRPAFSVPKPKVIAEPAA
jgi:hypothetical protein